MRYSKMESEVINIYDLYRSMIIFNSNHKTEIINRIKIFNPELANRLAEDLEEIDFKVLDLLENLNAIDDTMLSYCYEN